MPDIEIPVVGRQKQDRSGGRRHHHHHRHKYSPEHPPPVAGISAPIGDLVLRDGHGFTENISNSVTDASLERTISGASTLTISFNDPDRLFLTSQESQVRFDVNLDGLWFRLVKVAKQGDVITLTFEDREVAYLRLYKGPRIAFRDKMTRAEFISMLVSSVKQEKIPQVITELHKVQPTAKSKTQLTSQALTTASTPTFPQSGPMSVDQWARLMVSVAPKDKNWAKPRNIAIGLGTLANESDFGKNPGPYKPCCNSSGHCGPWQEEDGFGGCSGAERCDNIKATQCAYNEWKSRGWQPWTPYSHGDQIADQYIAAATRAIQAGGVPLEGSGTTVVTHKRYAFEVKAKETYWDAIQRLAGQVKWTAFCSSGQFWYANELDLVKHTPIAILDEDAPGVDSIDFDYDMGKKITQITVTAQALRWAAPPGYCVNLSDNMGVVAGNYLVSDIQGSLFDNNVTVTLTAAMKPLPEPAAETHTKAVNQGQGSAGYVNPNRDANIQARERIDMGVDFAGTGYFSAIGDGIVLYSATGTGWPGGGGYISYKLTGPGKYKGYAIFHAEGVKPLLKAGQRVKAGQHIASLIPGGPTGTESGFASGGHDDLTYASTKGGGYNESDCTAAGRAYNAFLKELGDEGGSGCDGPKVGHFP